MSDLENKPLLSHDNDDEVEIQENSFSEVIIEKVKGAFASLVQKDTLTILIYVLLYIICGVINSVLLKSVMNAFRNYGFFLSQLTNYCYIPIFGSVVAYKVFFTNDIPEETKKFPYYKFAVMGALDAVTGYFVVLGGISTSGPLQQLLNQAIIPFTMITSFIFLKERFSLIQLGGALVIVGGVIIALVPSLTGNGNTGNKVFWNIFYLGSIIPYAFSNVYKDYGFKSVEDMDVWWLQFWDGVFQSVFGIFLFPVNAILPPPAKVPFNEVIPSLRNGTFCLAGHNSWTLEDSTCSLDVEASLVCDECNHAYVVMLAYMAINVVYNIFILLVIKHAGATVFSIANTIRLPLTNVVFSLKFIMGKNVVPFSGLSIAGLIVILMGVGGYRVGSIIKNKKAAAAAIAAGLEPSQIRVIPGMGPAGVEVNFATKPASYIKPKSTQFHRKQYFGKLGMGLPESQVDKNTINGDNVDV